MTKPMTNEVYEELYDEYELLGLENSMSFEDYVASLDLPSREPMHRVSIGKGE